jgi:hypothetical protein
VDVVWDESCARTAARRRYYTNLLATVPLLALTIINGESSQVASAVRCAYESPGYGVRINEGYK